MADITAILCTTMRESVMTLNCYADESVTTIIHYLLVSWKVHGDFELLCEWVCDDRRVTFISLCEKAQLK